MKLRWWNPEQPLVVDVCWEPIPDTELGMLLLEDGYGNGDGLKLAFFDFHPANPSDHAIWVLALMRQDESMTSITKTILRGRQAVVVERSPYFEI